MFGTRPKRIKKLEIFSGVFFLIIIFFSGFVSVMTTRNETQPSWKTMRNNSLEPNGDTKSIDETKIVQLYPQLDIIQYRILFDEAHNPNSLIEENEHYYITYNYRLYMELIGLGHAVDIFKSGSLIDLTLLSNYDLLVIPGSYDDYDPQEIVAIEVWVNSGGNILIFDRDGYSTLSGAEEIALRFGFRFSEEGIYDDEFSYGILELEGTNILLHPITANVQKLIVGGTRGITHKPSGARTILKSDDDGTAYYQEYPDYPEARNVPIMSTLINISGNGGRLVVLAINSIWNTYDTYVYSFPYFYLEDNRQLAINTFNWLVDKDQIMNIDNDNDTLSDYLELYVLNSDPYSNDTDQDNLLDIFEYENGLKLNSNDTDGDGLNDFDEYYNLPTNPILWDTDKDLLGDGDEYFVYGTNATLKDTDIDGIPDGYEVFNLMDPLDETDAVLDYDDDQLTNLEEYKFGGNIYNNDTDADGLLDYDEIYIYYTKVFSNDTDLDGLTDYDELFIYHTDPRDRDTDDDNYSDRLEILEGWDPLDPDDPFPRPWVSEPMPTVKISISIFSILVIVPLIPTVIYIKRKRK